MRRLFLQITLLIASALFLFGFANGQISSSIPLRTTHETPPPFTPSPTTAEQPQPILVWTMYDPWRTVVGSDSPHFALYDDGTVIYYDEAEEGYLSVQLTEDEMDEVLSSLPVEAFFELDDYYDLVEWTDQPSHALYVWQGSEVKIVTAYGDLTEPDELDDPVPQPFMTIFEVVSTFEDEDAEPWLPEQIEVLIWEADGHDDEATDWPQDWPGLDDPNTVERDSGIGSRMYSIYLPVEHFEEFRSLMNESGGRAVLDGQDWYVSYRFPFPQEQWWMQSE